MAFPQTDVRAADLGSHAYRNVVQFYDDDPYLVSSIARFAEAALRRSEAVVLVVTEPHARAVREELRRAGFGLDAEIQRGQFVILDSIETLDAISEDGTPHALRFDAEIGDLIARLAGRFGRVNAFGEMVTLLAELGRFDAALHLESLWHALLVRQPFDFLCAYPIHLFGFENGVRDFRRVCDAHSHVRPTERFASLQGTTEQLRAVSELQQKALAYDVRELQRAAEPHKSYSKDDVFRLARALRCGELRLHYQPVCNLESGEIEAYEALVRWQPETGPLLPPAEFIPLAEESGLIVAIGEWVLRTACSDAVRWQKEEKVGMRVAVNVSARQLAVPTFVPALRRVLADTGLDPSLLVLEITESIFCGDDPIMNASIGELDRAGIRMAMDDFGTGYSSLAYLKRLPIAELKIDRAFVRQLETDDGDRAIVTAILSMARALGLHVIAEGVETEGQLAFLRECGCEAAQGFLIGRPQPKP